MWRDCSLSLQQEGKRVRSPGGSTSRGLGHRKAQEDVGLEVAAGWGWGGNGDLPVTGVQPKGLRTVWETLIKAQPQNFLSVRLSVRKANAHTQCSQTQKMGKKRNPP